LYWFNVQNLLVGLCPFIATLHPRCSNLDHCKIWSYNINATPNFLSHCRFCCIWGKLLQRTPEVKLCLTVSDPYHGYPVYLHVVYVTVPL